MSEIQIKVDVAGEELTEMVVSCSARLGFDGHDLLEVVLRQDLSIHPNESADGCQIVDRGSKSLGKPVKLSIRGDAGAEAVFEGTVTDVRFEVLDGGPDVCVLTGHGPLWQLGHAPRFRSFAKKDFSGVVREVLSACRGFEYCGEASNSYEYLVQHGETDLQFLSRLCRSVGEWLFFDGRKVYVGVRNDHGGQPIPLEWGKGLRSCRAEARCRSLGYQTRSYRYQTSADLVRQSKRPPSPSHRLGQSALSASTQFLGERGDSIGGAFAAPDEVEKAVTVRAEIAAAGLFALWGTATVPSLVPGRKIELRRLGDLNGEYRVCEVVHTYDVHAGYSCDFGALAANVRRPLELAYAPERASLQVGHVEENVDPDKLGRVKVRLRWNQVVTPWLRVLQVHAGAQHGLYVIPEKGDEVMVGYECDDPDRPVVVGSLYHSAGKPMSDAVKGANEVKQFRTLAGNLIRVTDTGGGEEILVSSPDGVNTVTMRAGSNPSIELKSKGSISIDAGKKVAIKGGESIELSAPKIQSDAQQEQKLTAGTSIEVASKASMKLSAAANAELSSSATLAIKSGLIQLN